MLTRALEFDPENDTTQNNLAMLLSKSASSAARGLELAKRATAADPGNAGYWDTRAACAAAAGAGAEAEESWTKALQLIDRATAVDRGLRAQIALGFGRYLATHGRADEARAHLATVQRDAPSTPEAEEARRLLGL
jgi:Tfp pilus assembly protein PilF